MGCDAVKSGRWVPICCLRLQRTRLLRNVGTYLQTPQRHIPQLYLNEHRTRFMLRFDTVVFYSTVTLTKRTESRNHTYTWHSSLSATSGIAAILSHHQAVARRPATPDSVRWCDRCRWNNDTDVKVVIFIAGSYCLKEGEGMGILPITWQFEGSGVGGRSVR